jgi:ribose transport system substrate-binding protein
MRKSRWVLVPLLAGSMLVAACGTSSDDKATSASGGGGAAPATTKHSTLEAPTKPPTDIKVTEPLPKAPPKGKSLIFLQCELPTCERYVGGFKQAASALGWSAKFEVFKNANPGAGLQQAISEKPDYIAITGIPTGAVKAQLAQAEKSKIPVISCATPDAPAPGGYTAQCGGTLVPDAQYLSSWVVGDAGGKPAHVVGVSIPQFPVLNTETDWFKKNFSGLCSDCKYDALDVTVDDIGSGAVAQKLIGYLQSHPDVNYVFFTFNNLANGVSQALKSAGLGDKVKLIGAAGDASIMKSIGSDHAAWTIAPNEYSAYTMVDAMARLSVGQKLDSQYQAQIYKSPTWVVDSPDSANLLKPTGYDWYGPQGFQQKFEQLWDVR